MTDAFGVNTVLNELDVAILHLRNAKRSADAANLQIIRARLHEVTNAVALITSAVEQVRDVIDHPAESAGQTERSQ